MGKANAKTGRGRRKANRGYEPKDGWAVPPPSREAIAKAEAKVDAMIAGLRGKVAKAAGLEAKKRRLEREMLELKFNLAGLAARIHPELCETNPVEAISWQ